MEAYFSNLSRRKKISCRMLEGEKNILQAQTPRKKNSLGIKGLEKNSCQYQITQPPPFRS